MKKNLLKLTAILIAIAFSAFTGKAKLFTEETTYCFKFVGDPKNAAQVLDLTKYVDVSFSCPRPEEIVCAFCTTDAYTHTVIDGDETKEVPNTPTDNPDNESILTLNLTLGYLDTAPNPDVQYYKLAAGVGYVPFNKHH